jgi:hypothetical protein
MLLSESLIPKDHFNHHLSSFSRSSQVVSVKRWAQDAVEVKEFKGVALTSDGKAVIFAGEINLKPGYLLSLCTRKAANITAAAGTCFEGHPIAGADPAKNPLTLLDISLARNDRLLVVLSRTLFDLSNSTSYLSGFAVPFKSKPAWTHPVEGYPQRVTLDRKAKTAIITGTAENKFDSETFVQAMNLKTGATVWKFEVRYFRRF